MEWLLYDRDLLERVKIRFFDIINMFHKYRSSCPKVFCKIDFVKDFTKFARKHLCRSLVLKKTAHHGKLQRESNTGVFLWVFKNTYFEELLQMAAFWSVLWKQTTCPKRIRKDNSWSICQLWNSMTTVLVLLYQQIFVLAQTNLPAAWRFHVMCIHQSNFKFCAI